MSDVDQASERNGVTAMSEPYSETRRAILGVLLGVALGAFALAFRRRER